MIENKNIAEATPAEAPAATLAVTPIDMAEVQREVAEYAQESQPNDPLLLGNTPLATANSSSQVEDAPGAATHKEAIDTVPSRGTASSAEIAATHMAGLGIATFALHGAVDGNCTCKLVGCRSTGKHPRLPTSFNGASSSPKLVAEWFHYYPGINYGVPTGQRIQGGDKMLVVIDIDIYKSEANDTMDDLEAKYGRLPDTVAVQTGGGGRHLYFFAPAGVKFKPKLGPGVDFKGIGGYVVGPGSVHASGKEYVFEADNDLFEGHAIADLPQWIVDNFSADIDVPVKPKKACSLATLSAHEIASIKLDLHCLNADDYDTWVDVLMALKSTGDEANGRALAEAWSQTSAKHDPDEFRNKWEHGISADGGITVATIHHLVLDERLKEVDISRILDEAKASAKAADAWSAVESFAHVNAALPYPLQALPQSIQQAVAEVHQFVKAPIAMVACSAIATLSLAAQALYDVERAPMLSGPISLYLLTIADSGERKSTLDAFFAKPIRDYEKACAEKAKPLLTDYSADMAGWEATKKGLADRMAQDAKNDKDTGQTKLKLRGHEAAKPAMPVVPRLIYEDTTPEALLHKIASEWPSAGIVSSEGGAVLGGHGMSKDAQLRNLAAINSLWDGKAIRTDRRTSASFTAEGRLTVAIQVQQAALKAFFNNTAQLARGTGFLARFLPAWPDSTQGDRLFTKAPDEWPKLEAYRIRISEILDMPQPIIDGRVRATMLYLSSSAHCAWIKFHDEIETQLGVGGDLHDVRDVASKTADNAARMAALFHIFEGEEGPVQAHHMESAMEVMRWHLNESQRLLSGPAPSTDTDGAEVLANWLVKKCKATLVSEVTFGDIQQLGPKAFRKKDILEPLLDALVKRGYAKVVGVQPRVVKLNPALLSA
jgi:hypothetical protein